MCFLAFSREMPAFSREESRITMISHVFPGKNGVRSNFPMFSRGFAMLSLFWTETLEILRKMKVLAREARRVFGVPG